MLRGFMKFDEGNLIYERQPDECLCVLNHREIGDLGRNGGYALVEELKQFVRETQDYIEVDGFTYHGTLQGIEHLRQLLRGKV
jgi:hypothetical protein